MGRDAVDGSAANALAAGDDRSDLAALGHALWRRKYWIIVATVAAALAAGAVVQRVTPTHMSRALVLVDGRASSGAEAQSQLHVLRSREFARTVVRDLKLDERRGFGQDASTPLVSRMLAAIGLARDPSRMTAEERALERYQESLSIRSGEGSRLIAIDFQSEDPALAADVANAAADRLLGLRQAEDMRIVSRAVPEPTPQFPRKLPIVLFAAFAAMILAVTFVALRELRSGDRRRDAALGPGALPAELMSRTPAAWIGRASEPASAAPAPPGKVRERRLALLAERVASLGRGVMVITGATGGPSAAPVAIDLARELADEGKRVLLLDLDAQMAPLIRLVGDPRVPGLSDLLLGVATFSEVIQRDRASRVHVITVGRGIRDSAALLTAEKFSVVLAALSQTYEHVLIAAPALVPVPGAARLARFSRGLLLVAEEGAEGVGAAASDALAAKGFANVAVVSLAAETGSSDGTMARAAA